MLKALGLSIALSLSATPAIAQQYSASEESLTRAYSALGDGVGDLTCQAIELKAENYREVVFYLMGRLTPGDLELFGIILNTPDDNYYKKIFNLSQIEAVKRVGCVEQLENLQQ